MDVNIITAECLEDLAQLFVKPRPLSWSILLLSITQAIQFPKAGSVMSFMYLQCLD